VTEARKKAKAMRSTDGPGGAAHQLRCAAPGVETRGLPTPLLAASRADVVRLKLPLTISPPPPELPFQNSPVAESTSNQTRPTGNPNQTKKWLPNSQVRGSIPINPRAPPWYFTSPHFGIQISPANSLDQAASLQSEAALEIR
jgi:hypothetical protein